MPKARVNGIELYYEIHGDGDPLVINAGLGRSSESLNPSLIEELSKSNKVIIL